MPIVTRRYSSNDAGLNDLATFLNNQHALGWRIVELSAPSVGRTNTPDVLVSVQLAAASGTLGLANEAVRIALAADPVTGSTRFPIVGASYNLAVATLDQAVDACTDQAGTEPVPFGLRLLPLPTFNGPERLLILGEADPVQSSSSSHATDVFPFATLSHSIAALTEGVFGWTTTATIPAGTTASGNINSVAVLGFGANMLCPRAGIVRAITIRNGVNSLPVMGFTNIAGAPVNHGPAGGLAANSPRRIDIGRAFAAGDNLVAGLHNPDLLDPVVLTNAIATVEIDWV